jgi:superoxide dismutase, Fe-Mn family
LGTFFAVNRRPERIAMNRYTLPDLPYDYAALEPWYSAEVLELHHARHHAAYVKGANDSIDALDAARDSDDFGQLTMLEKNLAFHLSGHVLHSILWENLSPDGGGEPDGDLAAAVKEHFGSFERLQRHLTAATATVQGVGWGALAWEPTGERLVVEQIYDHQGNIGQAATPLLVLDSWEHAYYLQYKNVKADYIDAMWNLINWDDVARRLDSARTRG